MFAKEEMEAKLENILKYYRKYSEEEKESMSEDSTKSKFIGQPLN